MVFQNIKLLAKYKGSESVSLKPMPPSKYFEIDIRRREYPEMVLSTAMRRALAWAPRLSCF